MFACMKCNRIMKIGKIGAEIVEGTEHGLPYKVWSSDYMQCPTCGITIAYVSALQMPLAEHYEAAFEKRSQGRPMVV